MWARITRLRLVMASGELVELRMDALRARCVRVEAVRELAVGALRREADPGLAVLGEEQWHTAEIRLPRLRESRVGGEEPANRRPLRRRESDDAPPPFLRECQRLAKHRDALRVELPPVGVVAVPPREQVTGV